MTDSVKPKSIRSFDRLNLVATLIGVANIIVHYGVLRTLAISKGASPAGSILAVILLGLSYLIFWFFIYRRGSNIAKWVFVAVTAISVAMIPLNLSEVILVGTAYAISDGVAFLFQLAAAAMLFRQDAALWFARKNNEPVNV